MDRNIFAKCTTSLHKIIKTNLLTSTVVLLSLITYLTLRLNDYLDSNAQGIYWAENRKLTTQELHIRVLKMMVLEEQEKFDQDRKDLDLEYYWRNWKVVTADFDSDVLFKLRMSHPVMNQSLRDATRLETVNKNQLHDDVFYKGLIEKKYMLNSITDSNMPQGDIWRAGASRIYTRQAMAKSIVRAPDVEDKIRGFGSYYFYFEKMIASDPEDAEKFLHVFKNYYEVNNCADSYYSAGFISKRYKDTNVITEYSSFTGKSRTVQSMSNPFIVFFNFFKGL